MSSRPTTPPTERKNITLLIVDQSELIRAGLKYVIGNQESFINIQIVGEAHSVASALKLASRLRPDVILLDVRFTDGSGFEVCREVGSRYPETKVLILTSATDGSLVYEAMNSGANGYLLKEIGPKTLIQSIIDVAVGKFILDPALTARVLSVVRSGGSGAPSEHGKLATLSAQEKRVLALVAEGMTNKEIAEQMGLSDKTVKNYLSSVFDKLKIKRRSQAAVIYLENRPRI